MHDSTAKCAKCGRSEGDTDDSLLNWVSCDKCQKWFHFECVGVTSDIANRAWYCSNCKTTTTDPMAETTTLTPSTLSSGSRGATPKEPTHNLTKGQQNEADLNNNTAASKVNSTNTDNIMSNMAINHARSTNKVPDSQGHTSSHENGESVGEIGNTKFLLAMLEEERQAKEEYIKKKYAILAQMGESSQNVFIEKSENTLTNKQLAARHAIPTDLPLFNGEPEDWPAFISSYEHSTNAAGFSNVENMLRLQKCLKGKARELVKDKLLLPAMVGEVISTLKLFFGRPEHIIERMVDKIRKMPPAKDKLESLIELALSVRNVCATMETCNLQAHLNNPLLIKELVEKLPNQYKLLWAMHRRSITEPTLKHFSDWMYSYAEVAATVVSPAAIKMHAVNAHINKKVENGKDADEKKCVVCENGCHKLPECEKFEILPIKERNEIVKKNNLCFRCLKKHRQRCFRKSECGINGCTSKHNPLLHKPQNTSDNLSQSAHGILSTHQAFNKANSHFFRIVPIKLYGKHGTVETFAFLDEGSSVTLIDKAIFDKLGIKGNKNPLCLQWTNDTTRMEKESICMSVQVSDAYGGKNKYWLNGVQTIENLALPQQSVDANYLKTKYVHMSNLPLSSYQHAEPGILIGNDNWKVAIPSKVYEGKWNEPIASKCRLGWAVQGGGNVKEHFVNVHKRCECEALHEVVKDSFNLDACLNEVSPKPDDAKAMQILDETCTKKNNRFEVGLLWQEDTTYLPDSYSMAFKRAQWLNKKMEKDPSLKRVLQGQIDNLVAKGYAKQLTSDEIEKYKERVWYLPIFVVRNPNKPSKVRLVWDAAAKSDGVCLNDFLLSGPDLLNSLIDVLAAFRVGKIAVCADIEEMFHRINIKDSDMHAQRFLWHENNNGKNEATVYVMKAMTFGIRCAPCIAHYVRNKNAEQYRQSYPRAYEAIQQAHYVDDFIDSMTDDEEATSVATQVHAIHAAGGFNIRNWASNSKAVLTQLLGEITTTQSKIEIGDTEKVLGMFWDPNLDVIRFIFRFARMKRNPMCEPTTPTKRELLQVLMSMFDPLGFLASHTVGLKILLQKVWRSNIGWDSQLPPNLNAFWLQCKRILQEIGDLQIPRCYSLNVTGATSVELHTFVDASEEAYAAVCYLRFTHNKVITTSLVLAKSKVAPLKPLSVPRLELQAAIVGIRLARRVQQIRRLRIDKSLYWTDSKTVLRWLRMDPRGFQQFVMFRVGEILNATDVSQWHWVPSKLNAADQATKVKPSINSQLWLHGPDFLLQECDEWPSCNDFGEPDSTELRKHVLHANKIDNTRTLFKFDRFSSWMKLYRSVAALMSALRKRLIAKRSLPQATSSIYENVQAAKYLLYKEAQKQVYTQEIIALKNRNEICKQSSLIKLEIYLDANDVMRAKGRVDSLNNNEGVIVLPKESHITYLIVKNYHEKAHHVAHETTVNLIRSDFYIPKLRVLYRSVRNNCQWCKNNLATPKIPQMAPIPRARLASFQRAFSYVGIDYFGPFLVNVGRRKEKRWGVIFTCLTLRAIHLEVAHHLDTSSCIMAIKNFISRRGTPIEVYSDNGTNFKGTEKIIKEQIVNVKYAEIELKFDSIQWYFNPPGAPHMGGIWERLIRSVKTVLKNICPSANFNDESLRSALCEIEFLINARPLTFVSLDSEDDDALTPNHILLGSPSGYKPFDADNNLRQRWTQTQVFAEKFWNRWVKEYLPIITKRCKWFQKSTPVNINDIVIIVDENLPRNCWPKGRIVDRVLAKDGQVRRVVVKTQHGLMKRVPVSRIAVLDVNDSVGKLDQQNFSYGGENVAAV